MANSDQKTAQVSAVGGTAPATVRVFLCTYRRNHLLRRSLTSLLTQTLTDWVCELHNDDPDDAFPEELVAEIDDPRIIAVTHARNLGAVETFNLLYDPRPERYVSLLEDDNWWERSFLEIMVAAMDANLGAQVGWANMRLWQEERDGTWTDLKRNIWDRPGDAEVEWHHWPGSLQADAALHSNGAMLVRSGDLGKFRVPAETMFEFVEPVRERAMVHPLLFVPRALANFSLTLGTARDPTPSRRLQHYVLLLASFFKHGRPDDGLVNAIWEKKRRASVRSTHLLLLAGLADVHCRKLLRSAKPSEWCLFFLMALKHPLNFFAALRAKSSLVELWDYLDAQTRSRFEQADQRTARPAESSGQNHG